LRGDWYRIPVTERNHKIDAAYLAAAGIAVASLDPRAIRLYGNGGEELSENVTASRPVDLVENAIYVEGESDGQFGTSDYVLFYGRSPRGWKYDSTGKTWRHYVNHYTETNYYWLTFGGARGKRMADLPSSGDLHRLCGEVHDACLSKKKKKHPRAKTGMDNAERPSGSFTHVNSLPGLVANGRSRTGTLVAHDETLPRFTVKDGGTHWDRTCFLLVHSNHRMRRRNV
jgi:hypothetical protein